jgi:hypothetical protein
LKRNYRENPTAYEDGMEKSSNKHKIGWRLSVFAAGTALGFVAGMWIALTFPFFEGFSIGPPPPPTVEDTVRLEILNICLKAFVALWWTIAGFVTSCIVIALIAVMLYFAARCRRISN